jgi:hypothetical protein
VLLMVFRKQRSNERAEVIQSSGGNAALHPTGPHGRGVRRGRCRRVGPN